MAARTADPTKRSGFGPAHAGGAKRYISFAWIAFGQQSEIFARYLYRPFGSARIFVMEDLGFHAVAGVAVARC